MCDSAFYAIMLVSNGKGYNQLTTIKANIITAEKKFSDKLFDFNPLYSDGFSHTDKSNKDGLFHYIS